jgi:hypothetical protein
MTKELVESVYLKAKAPRKPGKGLIFHSDHGRQTFLYKAARETWS